jgi:hypothetical protein
MAAPDHPGVSSMNSHVEELKTVLSSLPAAERAELAHYLLRSLDVEASDAKSDWLALAEQRMAEIRLGQVIGIPAEDVFVRFHRGRKRTNSAAP